MDALDAIRGRRSVREYENRSVPMEIVEQILDAGRMAPSAMAKEPWEFIVVTSEATRRQIAELTDYGRFIATAPVCIVVFCQNVKYYIEDGCAAVENMLLAAHALGLGACWVAGDKKPYTDAVAQVLGAPDNVRLVALIPVGYPAGPLPPARKRPLEDCVHREKF